MKFLAVGSGSNSAGATVVDKTGAGGRGVGGGFFLIFVFFCYATLLTPRPCPPYPTPTQQQRALQLQADGSPAAARPFAKVRPPENIPRRRRRETQALLRQQEPKARTATGRGECGSSRSCLQVRVAAAGALLWRPWRLKGPGRP